MFKNKMAFVAALLTTFVSQVAFAQDGAAANEFDMKALLAIGAGLAIGLGVLGGTLGQGKAATAALEGIARNPSASDKLFTPMILGLALIESLVIYALVIAFMLQGKI